MIPGADGSASCSYDADSLENQGDIVGAATNVIDKQTTITP